MMFGHPLGTCHALCDLRDGIFKCLRKLNGEEHNIQLFDPIKTPNHGRKPVTQHRAASMNEIHHWARASRRILGTEDCQYEIGRQPGMVISLRSSSESPSSESLTLVEFMLLSIDQDFLKVLSVEKGNSWELLERFIKLGIKGWPHWRQHGDMSTRLER
jgi:hypothetical protein